MAEKADQADQDQVDRDNVVEQSWDDQDEDAGDQCDDRLQDQDFHDACPLKLCISAEASVGRQRLSSRAVTLAGYAALPSVAHYLLVDTRRRLVGHHHRAPGEQEFRTSIARNGTLHLDPPGLDLDLDAIYAGSGV